MKLIVCDNYKEMSKAAANIIAEQINNKPESILGLATGSTPIGMYQELVEMYKKSEIDFSKVQSFNLDEYYPLAAENEQSYRYFMNEHLFSKVNIDKNNTNLLDGLCESPEKECARYEALMAEKGGIDLQVLGIGQNGHIGFNEPSENLSSLTHLTDLTQNTIIANSRFFDSIDEVPTKALTMGIGSILKARKIILLASGTSKHEAVKGLLKGSITTDMPASLLNVHNDVILICDKDAYSDNKLGVDLGGTEIKFGVINGKNELIYHESIPTDRSSVEKVVADIAEKSKELAKKYIISTLGVGTPGIFKNGGVTTVNLPFKNTVLKKLLQDATGMNVRVSNDANCAALAEITIGSKCIRNLVMISLGTGVGGGIIINNNLYEGKGSAGELGHVVIEANGKDCPCGLKGCFEQYASATALVKAAKIASEENADSILNKLYLKNNKMNGKIFFEAVAENCPVALKVLDEYTNYLAIGIRSIYNMLQPDIIVLSGGITNSGDLLLNPLKEKIGDDIIVTISDLKSNAGVIGAALL